MGVKVMSLSTHSKYCDSETRLPNPDPLRCEVLEFYRFQYGTVAVVQYLDCTNYEGKKILLYPANVTLTNILSQPFGIDPHFCEPSTDCISPIARFEPTPNGLAMATYIAKKGID